MLCDEGVEGVEMGGFLVVHVLHEGPEVRVAAQDGWCLGRVDKSGCELACLVDSKLYMRKKNG